MRFGIIKYINQLNEFKIGMNTYSVRKISLNGVDIATVDCNGIIIDKVAIYGDFSKYTSKPLKDFIYESNNGNAVFFTETQAQAVEKLSAAK